ncbi:ABC transporter ATP-binding protein [Mycobacterium kubicae]|uniref:ABC transporter ATP-binding protein n=1 Tax=Mycobacterium kubicae TaxID=120959 RepID=A0ABQ1BFV7_9MYCO|nr:ABC transporter ATP-binding protein [Mycobacterium kubicae]GFG62603.1 ABC transporter ATP-binding protein [Mycobacterium kubicae]
MTTIAGREVAVSDPAANAPAAIPAIRLDQVRKHFGTGRSSVAAVGPISLTVRAGEFVCLVGVSGCGKSTLLSLIAGLDRPTSGVLDTGGHRVALMFQEAALFPWLTAAGNVELALRARAMSRQQRRAKARELLETVGLTAFADNRPHQLSGGMQQRVALARALAQDADVLLMDEPFAALDALTRDRLQGELERIVLARNLTVVFVTHNVREAVRLADRVVLLSQRPATIVEQFDVALPRPRDINTAQVAELAAEITEQLNRSAHADGT